MDMQELVLVAVAVLDASWLAVVLVSLSLVAALDG